MDLALKHKRVLITGSSKGIGKAIAESFLQEGAKVLLTGRNKEDLSSTCKALSSQYGANCVLSFLGDLASSQTLELLSDYIKQNWQGLDHLVCNIGSGKSVKPLLETEQEWQKMLNINLLNSTKIVAKLTTALTQKNTQSSIIFINSICALEAIGCPVAYASAKAALLAYANNITKPMAEKNIRINSVSPGNIIFDGSTWQDKISKNNVLVQIMLDEKVPLKRLGLAQEVADIVVFLASDRTSFVTGANWVIDGGQTQC